MIDTWIRVTTGCAVALLMDDPDRAVRLVTPVAGEFAPDEVFEACNRFEGLDGDQARLRHAWQRELRKQLDWLSAPSMSVGDMFEVMHLGTWQCLPTGWRFTREPFEARS